MDTRSLIALGMVLSVVVVGILVKVLDGIAVKDIVIMLGSGIVGAMVPRAAARFRVGDSPLPPDMPAGSSGPNKISAP